MRKIVFGTATATLVLLAGTAVAAISFNTSMGTGFIGRGDVITYVGKSGLVVAPTIEYSDTVQISVTCGKDVEVGRDREIRTIQNNFRRTRTVQNTVQYETRRNPGNENITGYNLTGWGGATGTSQPIPTDPNQACASLNQSGEAGWYALSGLEQTSLGSGTLTFNGVPLPY